MHESRSSVCYDSAFQDFQFRLKRFRAAIVEWVRLRGSSPRETWRAYVCPVPQLYCSSAFQSSSGTDRGTELPSRNRPHLPDAPALASETSRRAARGWHSFSPQSSNERECPRAARAARAAETCLG